MSLIREKRKPKFQLSDLTTSDVQMLSAAANSRVRGWYCYGVSFYKLYDLELVDDDNMVTQKGRELLKNLV